MSWATSSRAAPAVLPALRSHSTRLWSLRISRQVLRSRWGLHGRHLDQRSDAAGGQLPDHGDELCPRQPGSWCSRPPPHTCPLQPDRRHCRPAGKSGYLLPGLLPTGSARSWIPRSVSVGALVTFAVDTTVQLNCLTTTDGTSGAAGAPGVIASSKLEATQVSTIIAGD